MNSDVPPVQNPDVYIDANNFVEWTKTVNSEEAAKAVRSLTEMFSAQLP